MQILAHRGASKRALENSMEAFRSAISSGCDGIEFDVHFCNGQALIIHDTNLLRTHKVDVNITELNETLRQQYQIPTLTQVMALLPPDLIINIEVKSCDDVPFMQEYMAKLSHLGLFSEHVVLSSFDKRLLEHLHCIKLPVKWGWLSEDRHQELPSIGGDINYDIVGISSEIATAQRITTIKQTGKSVWVFTLDEPAQWEDMLQLGVDGYFTNTPHEAVHWFNAR